MFNRIGRNLRHTPDEATEAALQQALPVDGDELVAAPDAARTGGATAVDRLASLLIEVDRANTPGHPDVVVQFLESRGFADLLPRVNRHPKRPPRSD
ncbi:MAG: hypothetical protein WKF72_11840 [Nocardioidaceae bacterium]